MKQKKRILILSMSGGFGHIRAGEALLEYAKEYRQDVEVLHADISTIDPTLKKYGIQIYDLASKKFPFIWAAAYKFMPATLAKKVVGLKQFSLEKIKTYIRSVNPDIILFANVVIVPMVLPFLKAEFSNIPMGIVVTDYHAHPYYSFPELDYYFVATNQVAKDLQKNGILKKNIVVTGIPVHPRFYGKETVLSLKKRYGIKASLPVVVFIASFTVSDSELEYVLKELALQKIHLVFIANGSDTYYQIAQHVFLNHKNVTIEKWTTVMEEYIKMADVVITKAGGLTVTECLTLKKPMIMVNPIPGQEEHNAAFLVKNKLGIKVTKAENIADAVPKAIALKKNFSKNIIPLGSASEKIFESLLK